jgi:hypothetical protein
MPSALRTVASWRVPAVMDGKRLGVGEAKQGKTTDSSPFPLAIVSVQ